MISDFNKARQIMAENGYEHTPAEAKEICEKFNDAIEELTSYENYLLFRDMDEEDMIAEVEFINSIAEDGESMTLEEFKEVRQFVLDVCDGK